MSIISSLDQMQKPAEVFDMLPFKSQLKKNTTHLLGFEFDGTACYRKGAANAPDDIRRQSPGIESYSPYLDHDTQNISAIDIGNLPIGKSSNIEKNWQHIINFGRFLHLIKRRNNAHYYPFILF